MAEGYDSSALLARVATRQIKTANPIEITASVMCTTLNPVEWSSPAMLRMNVTHTNAVHTAAARRIIESRQRIARRQPPAHAGRHHREPVPGGRARVPPRQRRAPPGREARLARGQRQRQAPQRADRG